ncbi:MAG TPA: peptidylprolyl isomerase, partial [Bacteroidota bacterium]|nr:peptidylprolyl isomerase [Bacteroidota bacterium]
MIKKSFVASWLIVAAFASVSQSAILLDKVIAIVNKEVITWSDVYREMEFNATDEIRAMKDTERRSFFKEHEMTFLETLIDMKLKLQEAEKNGITATDNDVETAVKNIKSKYNMTDEMLSETIKKDGFTLATYKKKIAEQIILNRVIDREVRQNILVTEREIDAYLAEHKDAVKDSEGFDMSQIVLKKTGDDKQLEQKAQDIYKRLKAGDSFAELARQYSDDVNARNGGELGFVRQCDMSKEFLDICSGVKPGEVSAPMWRNDGIYIIRVNEARVFKSAQEMREAIRQKLLSDKFDADFKSWS